MTDSTLSSKMLELLRCPCPAHATLTFLSTEEEHSTTDQELVCDECQRVFPIRDGIPVMLLDEARGPGD